MASFRPPPVGFGFHPTDEELVDHYLRLKMLRGYDEEVGIIAEVNVRNYEPWELPALLSAILSNDSERYFFCPRNYTYPNGQRGKRTNEFGYWKVTGKDRMITRNGSGEQIATKKFLVYHRGRPPGQRTQWVMHEYNPKFNFNNQRDFVLYRLKFDPAFEEGASRSRFDGTTEWDFVLYKLKIDQDHGKPAFEEVIIQWKMASFRPPRVVGFRFRPTDEELVDHYLRHKCLGDREEEVRIIPEVDVSNFDPLELHGCLSAILSNDPEFYFFCPRNDIYPNGQRGKRTTEFGNWKVTGKDRMITRNGSGEQIATKKFLVYHRGRPTGERTKWFMHEYNPKFNFNNRRDFVLYKLKFDPASKDGESSSCFDGKTKRAAVLRKRKHKAGETSANSPHGEGQPSRGVTGSRAANNLVQNTNPEVDIGHLINQITNNGEEFELPHEKEDWTFADSLLVEPEGCFVENSAHYNVPKSLSDVCGEGSSDRATEVFHAESFNHHEGHNRSNEYRQMQMAHGDYVPLNLPFSVGPIAATTIRINCIELVPEELPAIHGQYQLRSRDLVQEFPTTELQANFSSTEAKDKAIEAPKPRNRVVLPQKESFGTQPEKARKIIQVTNAKPDFKFKPNESAINDWKGRFIHLETTPSSHISGPPLLYLFKAVLGLVLFVIMLREAVVVR